MCIPQSSHQVLEHEVASESTVLQQRLEVMEDALGERERELAEARERIESLTDELVISQGKVDWQREGGRGKELGARREGGQGARDVFTASYFFPFSSETR